MNNPLEHLLPTRRRQRVAFASLVAVALVASTLALWSANRSAGDVTIWGESAPPDIAVTASRGSDEIGTRFSPTVDGSVTAIRFFKTRGATGTHKGALYSASGEQLSTVQFSDESATGWQTAELSAAVELVAGESYVVTYTSESGTDLPETREGSFDSVSEALVVVADASSVIRDDDGSFVQPGMRSTQYWVDVVYRLGHRGHPSWSPSPDSPASADPTSTPEGTTTPTPSPSGTSPAPSESAEPTSPPAPTVTPEVPSGDAAGFPTASTTGVPAGWIPTKVVNGDYTLGDDGTVVEDLRVVGGILYVRGNDITLRRVELVGARIVNEYAGTCYSGLRIEDSSIVKGAVDLGMPAIESGGYSATRVKIDGVSEGFRVGGADVGCGPVSIVDSWVRVTPPDDCTDNSSWHGDGLQGYLGVELTIKHSAITLVERPDCTGTSAFFYPDQGNTSAHVDDVLLAGGGYVFRLGTRGSVTNLKIVEDSWDYGPVDVSSCGEVTWGTGNEVVRVGDDGALTSVRALACATG